MATAEPDNTTTETDDQEKSYPLGPTPEKSVVQTEEACTRLRNMDVTGDPNRTTDEKETAITLYNQEPYAIFHSSQPTMIKWFLSIEGSTITDYEEVDGAIVAVTGRLSQGYLKLQNYGRSTNQLSRVVSYGGERE